MPLSPSMMPQSPSLMPQSPSLHAPVRVKNTFIDVEESPKEGTWGPETSRRCRSMPPPPMLDTPSEDEDDSNSTPADDEVSSPLSVEKTHYSESPRPTQDRHLFPSRLASWPFIPDNMMVFLPVPPTPSSEGQKDVEKVSVASELSEKKKKLTCDFDAQNGSYRVTWYVDARKLDSNDKQAVSPAFELAWKGEEAKTFKVMLFPEAAPGVRGAYNFKKSRGRGYIRLKCEDEVNESTLATVKLSMGEESRGPVKHDFAHSVSCGLQKRQAVWDCKKLCEEARLMLLVTLDIKPLDPRDHLREHLLEHRELA